MGGQLKQEQLIVQLTAIFGGLALLLTLIGVYGVTAFSASQRTRDVAIRIALGATRLGVFAVVIRECGASVVAGLCIGAGAALGAGLLLRSRLYGVTWYSPVYLGAAITTLALFALMAMLVPAKRATAVDPIEALRLDG